MSTQVAPATLVEKIEWQSFSLNRYPMTVDGYIVYKPTAAVNYSTNDYLGTPEGTPVKIIQLNKTQASRHFDAEQVESTDLFGEVVVRADGTTATLMELINEKLKAAVDAVVDAVVPETTN